MNALRFTLAAITLTAFLAGCGGTPNALSVAPSSVAPNIAHVSHGTSWMLPEASGEDLLYVITGDNEDEIGVYDYTTDTLVGTLTGFYQVDNLCSDSVGDVYALNEADTGSIVEYAHGASTPTRVINFPDKYAPVSCSINPRTGDLAVAADYDYFAEMETVFVYRKAKGIPKSYPSIKKLNALDSVTYTGNGDIVLLGYDNHTSSSYRYPVYFALLPHNGKKFHRLKVSHPTSFRYHALAWDGTYLTVLGRNLSRFDVTKRNLKKVGEVLTSAYSGFAFCLVTKYGQVAVSDENDSTVNTYDYPSGTPVGTLSVYEPLGIAFSVASTHARIR